MFNKSFFYQILPDTRNGLNKLTDSLTLDLLNEGLEQMRRKNDQKITLSLPKFTLRTGIP